MYECSHELFLTILVLPFVVKTVVESVIYALRSLIDDNDDQRQVSWNSIKTAMIEMDDNYR